MPQRCCVSGCSTSTGKPMFFCSHDSALRASWEAAIPRDGGIFPKTIWCCEDHFPSSDIISIYTPGTPFQTKVMSALRQGAVPSVFPATLRQAQRPTPAQDSWRAAKGRTEHLKQPNSDQNSHGISEMHSGARQRRSHGYCERILLRPRNVRDPGADVARTMQPSTSHSRENEDLAHSRTARRHKEQNICDAIYCDDCGQFAEEPCWDHVSHIENTPVVPLALASLPECLMIDICENSHEKGVFSKNSVDHQTLFGPMVGALCSSTAYSPFGCRAKDGSGIKRFHLDSDSCCNWMRYVRFAKNKREQNLMACMHGDEVYFVVTKEIQSGEELKVGYSRRYQEMLKECPEQSERCSEPVEHVGLPADWEPEVYPVEPSEMEPDPVELQTEEEVSPSVRRSKRKRNQTRFYGTEGDEAEDDSESKREEIYRKFVNPGPYLPTDECQDSPPVEDLNAEALSALISPAPNPDPPNENPSATVKQKRSKDKKRYESMRRNPASVIKFPCTECLVHFPSEESLVIHSRWHDGKEMNVEECPECGLFFDEFGWLAMHVNLHATRYEPRERCRLCSLFISSSRMDLHMQNSHPLGNFVSAILNPSGSGETSTSVATVNVFKCDECDLCFSSERLLTLHSRQHSGIVEGMEQECPECNIVIEDAAEWMQHINEHGTKFVSKDKCKYCPHSFERGKMDFHVRHSHPDQHGDERETFPCDICGLEMASPHSLRMHHTAKHLTPQCVICAKIEESWRTLSQHVLTHQEEDGFHCPHCTLVFGAYHRVSAHCRDIHLQLNVLTCDVCGKSFRNRRKLNLHLRTHSDEHEFSCERCGHGFHTRHNLQSHVKSMHKETEPAS